jgi:TetR/AcrR family transcriptional regulator, regulator of autoinduction and epiphytic fitness
MGETSVTGSSPEVGQTPAAGVDGRLNRAARTRAAVVEALLTLNDRGNLRPTARDIAAEAGVSLRSLYVHFDDLEALFVAAGNRHAERLAEVLPPLRTTGDLRGRLDAFLDRRVRLNETGAGVRRAAQLQEPFSPVLQHALATGRKALRAEVKAAFAPELAATTAPAGRLLTALDIAASPAAWESLRTHQGLSVDEATAQVRDMIVAFLDAWTSTGATPHPDDAGHADTTDPTDPADTTDPAGAPDAGPTDHPDPVGPHG